jgi:hypothetical protein
MMNWQLCIREAIEAVPIGVPDSEIMVEVLGTLKECEQNRIRNGYS